MEKKRLKLPIGLQTFEELRTEGYLYVDKTKFLVEMVDSITTHLGIEVMEESIRNLIFEAKAEEAYHQIIDQNYAAPYPHTLCLGIGIDDKKREICSFVGSIEPF